MESLVKTSGLLSPSIARPAWTQPSVPLWTALWALVAVWGWLLPNHYFPWVAFHVDAWVAWGLLIGSAVLIVATANPVKVHRLPLVVAVLLFVPTLQWLGGLMPYAGQAWVTTAYLLGFLLSLLVGAHAEATQPERALDALFLAIGGAAILSVGIQLYQWFWLSGIDIWIVPISEQRPFGNLAQPNQMATFLLWGLVAIGWGSLQKKLSPGVAVLAALYLLLGIALTQSRTAIVSITVVAVLVCYWRRLFPAPLKAVVVASGLLAYFAACLLVIEPISRVLLLPQPFSALERIGGADIRWEVYKLFVSAALQQPWWGFGWTTLAPAQLAVAESQAPFTGIFQQSHNLFLDLIVWVGIPLGATFSAILVIWFVRRFIRVNSLKNALLVIFVLVFGMHTMLELPHHYAYMLLPVGLVMGVLNTRLGASTVAKVSRAWLIGLWAVAATLLGLITRDYFLIEADFLALRFEKAYRMPAPEKLPNILVLDHLAEQIRLGRSGVSTDMSQQDIDRWRVGADSFPSPSNLYMHIAALAMNGRVEEAQIRMRKIANVLPPDHYDELGRVWVKQSKQHPALARVEWLPRNGRPPAPTNVKPQ